MGGRGDGRVSLNARGVGSKEVDENLLFSHGKSMD